MRGMVREGLDELVKPMITIEYHLYETRERKKNNWVKVLDNSVCINIVCTRTLVNEK